MTFHFFRQKKPDSPALTYAALLIDMQEGFLSQYADQYKRPLISAQLTVLEFCVSQDIPVAVIESQRCGLTASSLRDVIAKIPRSSTIEKSVPDAFYSTSLDEQLQQWSATDLLVMGIYASICVSATSRHAVEKGYLVHTAKDVIADPFTLRGEGGANYYWFKDHTVLHKTAQQLIDNCSKRF